MQDCIHAPQAAVGRVYRPRKPRVSALYQCAARHAPELRAGGRFGRRVEENVVARFLACGEWVEANVLAPVPHRQYVFTVPRLLRPMFARRRALLGKLCHIVERLFARFYASARPGARPGLILFVQTFGDLVNFNPHIHVLSADGAFDADGGFTVLPPVPRTTACAFARATRPAGAGSRSTCCARPSLWRRCPTNRYRAPSFIVQECTRRSSGTSRSCPAPIGWHNSALTSRIASSTWARLIHKVYEVDPLECPRCKGPMRVIALIDDKAVIRKILAHLGLWAPQIAAGRGPGPPAPDPPRPAAPILTYHPVPDIA